MGTINMKSEKGALEVKNEDERTEEGKEKKEEKNERRRRNKPEEGKTQKYERKLNKNERYKDT